MDNLLKRLLSFTVALVMVLGMIPVTQFEAKAATETETVAEHTYKANVYPDAEGKATCPVCKTSQTWTKIEDNVAFDSGKISGHYYIDSDTYLPERADGFSILIESGAKICLHLNGHTLTMAGNLFMNYSTVNLIGGEGGGTIAGAYYKTNASYKNRASTLDVNSTYVTLNVYDVAINKAEGANASSSVFAYTGGPTDKTSAKVTLYGKTTVNGPSFMLSGRVIAESGVVFNGDLSMTNYWNTGNASSNIAAAWTNPVFTLNGGTITGKVTLDKAAEESGKPDNDGGPVLNINSGALTGTIEQKAGTVNMDGGSITNTNVKTVTINDGEFNLNNGTVNGRFFLTATWRARKLAYSAGKLTMTGGTVNGLGTKDDRATISSYGGGAMFAQNGATIDIRGGTVNGGWLKDATNSYASAIYLTGAGLTSTVDGTTYRTGVTNLYVSGDAVIRGQGYYDANGNVLPAEEQQKVGASGTIQLYGVKYGDADFWPKGDGVKMTMTGGTIYGGYASNGGAIQAVPAIVEITGGTIYGGKVTGNGGAINFSGKNTSSAVNSTLTIRNARITGGQAGGNGGNLVITNGNAVIDGATIENGVSTTASKNCYSGGGNIYMSGKETTDVTITNSTIQNGRASMGGNLTVTEGVDLYLNEGAKVLGGYATTVYGAGGMNVSTGRVYVNEGAEISGGTSDSSASADKQIYMAYASKVYVRGGTIGAANAQNIIYMSAANTLLEMENGTINGALYPENGATVVIKDGNVNGRITTASTKENTTILHGIFGFSVSNLLAEGYQQVKVGNKYEIHKNDLAAQAPVEATCITDGYTLHKCSYENCDGYKTDKVAADGMHTWDNYTWGVGAAHTAECTRDENCTAVCNAENQTFTYAPGKDYNYGFRHEATCNVCGQWFDSVDCVAKNEKWINAGSNHTNVCKDCGATMTAPHNVGNWVTGADKSTRTCSDCDYTETCEPHDYSEWTITDSEHSRTCRNCGYVDMAAHTPSGWGGMNDQQHMQNCTVCMKAYYGNHEWGEWSESRRACTICNYEQTCMEHQYGEFKVVTEPGCYTEGWQEQTCTICGNVNGETVPQLGCDWVAQNTVEPTCTEQGYTVYKCSRCGETKNGDFQNALGHNQDTVLEAVPATCTATGLTAGAKCSRCGEVQVAQTVVDALGHEWSKWTPVNDEQHKRTCSRCDAEETAVHGYKEFSSAVGNCMNASSATVKCDDCGHTKTTFGEIDPNNHVSIQPVAEKAPTLEEAGYEAHYKCVCGALFADAAGTESIEAPVAIPKLIVDTVVPDVIPGGDDEALTTEQQAAVKDVVNNSTKVNEVQNLPETHYLKITVTKATVADNVITKLTYDVTPYMGDDKVDSLDNEITFYLPVPYSTTKTVAAVFHGEDLLGTEYEIKTNGTEKWVEVKSSTFSEFTVDLDYTEPVTQVEVATLAELQEALADNSNDLPVILTQPIVIAAGEKVVLDLNGKNVTYTGDVQGVAMITNRGELTINDSVGTSVINYNYIGAADNTYSKGNYTISNAGKLTVNGGKITIANISGHAKYPIDNNSTTGNAELVINGGHLYNYNTSAIRLFCNSTVYKNTVTINGGLIEGYSAIWMQNPGSSTVNGQLAITGGEIRTTAKAYVNGNATVDQVGSGIYCTVNGGQWSEDSSVAITGGTINENLWLSESAPEAIEVDEAAATINGVLELPEAPYVSVGTLAELQAALAADSDLPIVITQMIVIGEGETEIIDLNGKTVTTAMDPSRENGHYYALENYGTLTIKDTKGGGSLNARGNFNYGTMTLESGTINAIDGNGGYGVQNKSGATFTMTGGTIAAIYDDGDAHGVGSDATPVRIDSGSKATITGGTITNVSNYTYGITSYGELTLGNDVKVEAAFGGVSVYGSSTTITGGTYTVTQAIGGHAVYVSGSATANISGGTFTPYGGNEVCSYAAYATGGTTNITGGTFGKGGNSTCVGAAAEATMAVSGGTFSAAVAEKYCAEGFEPAYDETTGKYGVVESVTYVAQIGDVGYATLEAAFAAAAEGETIVLLSDAKPVLTSQRAITKAAVIDLNGNTLTLTEDDLYFGTTTFKNGTVVVDPSVKPSTAVFWMFANQTLTFDGVKLVATGVTGTYLIGLDGVNADLNIVNGSEIVIENETALDLDVICVNSSTGNDILVENSKVSVTNLDGRVFFRGNYTISGTSDIDLNGITKAGFRIEAGQTLTIADTATVDIVGEPRDGGIHLTDTTAVYTKADTATVNATLNKPVVYVAEVNGTKYETLAEAAAAAKSGDEIILLADAAIAEGTDVTIPDGVTLNGNGFSILASGADHDTTTNCGYVVVGGTLTIKGITKIEKFSASYFNHVVNIGQGASLEVFGKNRVTVGYGNTFNITGTIADAKNADKSQVMASLRVPAGISIAGNSGVTFNVKNAYISVGLASGKNLGGTFAFSFENSIADFSNNLTFTTGSPVIDIDVKDSVLNIAANLDLSNAGADLTLDNSVATVNSSMHNDGKINLINGSTLTIKEEVATIEHGGNAGSITVDASTLTVGGTAANDAFDGRGTGSLSVINGGSASVAYIANTTVTVDTESALTVDSILGTSSVVIDATAFDGTDTLVIESANMADYTAISLTGSDKAELVLGANGVTVTAKKLVEVTDAEGNVTYYATLAEAFAAANGETVTLLADIVLNETVTVPVSSTVTLDLNGKSISMQASILTTVYAINNLGTLTLKDSVGTGSVNARGIYNGYGNGGDNVPSAKLIVESGTYNAKGTNGGAAIFNYGIVEITGGTFTSVGGYSLNNQNGASMTVAGATANNGIYNSGATLTINGGNISGNRSGCHVIYAWNSNVTINGGEFYNNSSGNATVMAAGSSQLTINDGTFGIKDGRVPGNSNTWTSCLTDTANTATMTVNGGTFNGGFRVQAGTTMTINGGSYNDCYGSKYNIYGTVTVKGGSFTDETAKSFATKYLAEGYELGEDGQVVKADVAKIGDVGYATLAEAAAAAKSGDEIIILADVEENVTVPAGVIFNGNGKKIGRIYADGDITFKGITKAFDFDVNYTGTTINIIEGACLELYGTDRLVVGHGCTFNITGNITDAKTADKTAIQPSLIVAAGASFTGAGLNFNVTNAYIKFNGNSTSKNNRASSTFNFDLTNSIWEQTGVLGFYVPTEGMDPTLNFTATNSVLNSTSHLVFAVTKGEIVFDNSNVNVGTTKQIENRSTMTVKNGSVVNGAVATSSNAINPGTIIVEDATYAVTGQFSGSTAGTGTLVLKKGATVSVGNIKDNANIVIDATGMAAGDTVNFTGDLSNFVGTVEVVNNDGLKAEIVDGKIVLAENDLPGSGTEEDPYTISSVEELILFAQKVNGGKSYKGEYVKLMDDIDLAGQSWTPIGTKEAPFKGIFDGNDKTVSNVVVSGTVNAGFFGYADGCAIKNLTLKNVTVTGTDCVGGIAGQVYSTSTIDNCHVTGTVRIEGQTNVGGIAGKYYVKVSNSSVIGDGVDTSWVKGTYVAADLEGDNVGGIMGHGGESNNFVGNTVKNITISGTRKVGGIVGTTNRGTNLSGCTVENVTIKTTATEEYAAGNSTSMDLGGLIGHYYGATTGGTLADSTVKNVTFVTNGIADAGAIVGGDRTNPNAAPTGVTATGITATGITGATQAYLFVAEVNGQAYMSLAEAIAAANGGEVKVLCDVEESISAIENVTLTTDVAGGVTITNTYDADYTDFNKVTVASGITLNISNVYSSGEDSINVIEGTLNISGVYYHSGDAKTTIRNGGKVTTGGMTVVRYNYNADSGIYIYGDGNDETVEFTCNGDAIGAYSGTFYAEDAVIQTKDLRLDYKKNSSEESDVYAPINAEFVNSAVNVTSQLRLYKDAHLTLTGTTVTVGGELQVREDATPVVTMDSASVITAASVLNLDGAKLLAALGTDNKVTFAPAVAKIGTKTYSSVSEAINAAQDGDTVELLAGEISEYIAPWAKDTTHASEKSITLVGAADYATVLTGGLYLGYDDSQNRGHTITVKGITFKNKGILVAGQDTVIIEDNKFFDITETVIGTTGSATANAISVIGKEVNAVIKDNYIDGTASGGINLRDTKTVEVTGNTVTNTKDNSITVQNNTADGSIVITDNTLSNWGKGGEGRAVRANGGATLTVTGNVMTNAAAPEQFVKVTGPETQDVSGNYWNGETPMAANMFYTDLATDPALILKSYYTDTDKTALVQIPASVAKVDDTYYATLAEAFAAAQTGDTVKLLDDVTIVGETYTIADGVSITLDMNGKKITVTDNKAANVCYELFYIYGEMTVTGNGTIELTSTSNDTAYAKSSSIFHNRGGVLTIENGTYKHLGGTAMAFVVDNSANSFGDAYLYVNGGEIISENYIAVRMRMESAGAYGHGLSYMTVTDGYIYGANRGIWGQKSSGVNAKQGELTVTGGTIENNNATRGAIQIDTDSYEAQNMLVSVSGDAMIKGALKGGNDEFAVSGGTFTVAVPEEYCAEGFIPTENADGTFGVKVGQFVAQVNGNKFETLAEAIAAAQAGDEVILLADIALTAGVKIPANKEITLDLNGKTISGINNSQEASAIYVENTAKLTVKDSVGEGKITYAPGSNNVGYTVDVKGEFVLESGTIEMTGSWSIGYAVNVRPNSWGTAEYTEPSTFVMNGGDIVSSDGAVRLGSSSAGTHKNVSANFVMNGGKIDAAWDGVFIQQGDSIYDVLNFTINGGTIESDLNPIRVYGPAPTGYVNGQDCTNITLSGGTLTYTGTETYTWVIEGVLRTGGGSTADTIIDNGDIVVSAEFAQNAELAEDYKWVENTDGTYSAAAKTYVAQIGDVKFESVAEAVEYAKTEGITDLVLTLIGETTASTTDSFDLVYTTVFDSVTIKQADATKTYYLLDLYTGARTNGGKFVFDGVNLTVTEQYMFEGNVELTNNSVITSTAEANCFVYYATVTVQAGSKLKGVIDDIRGGTLIVDGGKTDGSYNTTADLRDAILTVNWTSSKLVIKNGAYVMVNSANEVGRLTVNGTMDVTDSKLDAYQWIAVNSGATMNVDLGSLITTKQITDAGKITIDVSGFTGTDVQVIKADMSGFTGTIELVNADETVCYKITEDGVIVTGAVASVNGIGYATLAEALAADGEVKLLTDVTLTETLIAVGETIDLNGHRLVGDAVATIKVNGGVYETTDYVMVGATEGKYLSTDAMFTVAPTATMDITIHSGTMTLNDPNWWTLDGQTLTIAEGAKFVVPAGYNMNVNGSTVIVNGEVEVAGTVTLYSATATVQAPANLNVVMRDGIGDKVWYTEGKYVVHNHTEETIPGKAPTLTETGLTDGVKCSVCGDVLVEQEIIEAEAQATVNGTPYAKLSDALKAAYAAGGATVQLAKNVDLGSEMLMVMDKVTLDLNGKTLKTTDYVMAVFSESYIIDSSADNAGRLDVSLDKLRLLDTNEALPVQMTNGIMFAKVNPGHHWGSKAGNYQCWFNSADAALIEAMKTTKASELGLKVQVEVKWSGNSSLLFTFSDTTVMNYINDERGWDNKAAMGLIMHGVENTSNLTYRVKVVAAADTEAEVVVWASDVVNHNYAQ